MEYNVKYLWFYDTDKGMDVCNCERNYHVAAALFYFHTANLQAVIV